MTLRLSWHLKPKTSTDHLRNDLDLGISLKSVGISQCFKEAIVAILGQVRVILVMGIVMNWHFSRSFRLIFLNTYDLYLSRSGLTNLTTLVPNHFAYSLCSQETRKHVY